VSRNQAGAEFIHLLAGDLLASRFLRSRMARRISKERG
jgi:hypothetical protein